MNKLDNIEALQNQCEDLHLLFVHSLAELYKFEYYRDLFLFASNDERMAFMRNFSGVLEGIERAWG